MSGWGMGVDLLKGGGGEGRFLSRKGGIELRLRRSVVRRGVGLILGGRSHIHMVIISGSLVKGRGVRMRRSLR